MFRLLNKIGRKKAAGFRDPDVDVTHLAPPRKVCYSCPMTLRACVRACVCVYSRTGRASKISYRPLFSNVLNGFCKGYMILSL